MYSINDIEAVVVLYKTEIAACKTLVTLNESAIATGIELDVLIYDNNITSQPVFNNIFSNLQLFYHHDATNPGVSKAYNFGVDHAKNRDKQFILLLDQDTEFPKDALGKYVDGINSFSEKMFCPILETSHRIYSPTKYYFRRGQHWDDVQPGVYLLKNKSALNSGLLIDITAYINAGGYKNKIPLYFSDFEFINRFRKVYTRIVVLDIRCHHSLSDIDLADYPNAQRRFGYYVSGSFNSISSFADYVYLSITIFLRATKLSIKYKRGSFLLMFLKQYLFAGKF